MVTVELALGLVAVAVLACGCGWGCSVILQQIHTVDVANQVARQVARGQESAAQVVLDRERGAGVSLGHEGDLVVVTVTLPGRTLGVFPAIETRSRATAVMEPQQ